MSQDKFFETGEGMIAGQCAYCRHLARGAAVACTAFPTAIPDAILQNRHDHRRPWIDPETGQPGDEGIPLDGSILFDPKPTVPGKVLERLYRLLDRQPV